MLRDFRSNSMVVFKRLSEFRQGTWQLIVWSILEKRHKLNIKLNHARRLRGVS